MFRQIGRFGFVGVSATAIHVTIAFAATALAGLQPQAANLAGFSCAFLFSYFGHLRYTFQKGRTSRNFFRFLILSAFGYVVSSGIVFGVTGILGQDFAWAMAIIVLVVPSLTFLAAKFWAYSS